jgi:hypothetical protein
MISTFLLSFSCYALDPKKLKQVGMTVVVGESKVIDDQWGH